MSQADLIVESVFEDLALKQTVFKELDQASPPHAILASNTSSFPPTQLAAATTRPDKVLVAHYFNPPYLLPLVEVVKGEATSAETVARVCSLLVQAGKQPVLLKREVAGFIANRLQAAVWREAIDLVLRGVASVADVDKAMAAGPGLRWALFGPHMIFHL